MSCRLQIVHFYVAFSLGLIIWEGTMGLCVVETLWSFIFCLCFILLSLFWKDIAAYRAKGKPDAAKKGVVKAEKSKKKKEEEDDEEDEEDEEEEEEEEDEDEEEDDDDE